MARQQHDISTKDFRDPLLRVLGTKTGFKPCVEVFFESTYDPTFAIVGCTRDQYGTQPASGIPWTERWTQWAFNDLVKAGLGKRAGRGKWSLTQEGCDKAHDLCGTGTVTVPVDNPAVDNPAVETEDPAPVAPKTLSLDVGPGQPETGYSDDPYLRALAVQGTPCYGGFSPQSPRCASCPVRSGCMNALSASLSQAAALLTAEDKAAEAAAKTRADAAARRKAAASSPAPSPAAPVNPPTSGAPLPLGGVARQIEMPVTAVCRHCGQPIPQGSQAMWVKDTASSGASAMLHLDCFKALKGGKA